MVNPAIVNSLWGRLALIYTANLKKLSLNVRGAERIILYHLLLRKR
jgi:hypothetical protein